MDDWVDKGYPRDFGDSLSEGVFRLSSESSLGFLGRTPPGQNGEPIDKATYSFKVRAPKRYGGLSL